MDLLDRRFHYVVGKGGVGKTTVATGLALAASRRGKKVLLALVNCKERVSQLLHTEPIGPEIVTIAENLDAVNMTPDAALEEYGMMILRFKRVYKLVFENRITESFLKAIPGIEEYAVLGKAWYHTKETKSGSPVWDTVVFDMAASGHSLSMLRIPWAIAEAVPDGPLTRDARDVQKLLVDPERTGVVMVTLAEDMPSNEAIELTAKLKEHLAVDVDSLVVNQLYPDLFPEGSPQEQVLSSLARDGADGELASITQAATLCESRRRLNEEHLDRLRSAIALPQVHLPRLFVPMLGAAEIDEFSRQLSQELLPD